MREWRERRKGVVREGRRGGGAPAGTIRLENRLGNRVRVRFYCTYEDASEPNPLWRVRSQATDWSTDRTSDPKKLVLEIDQTHTLRRPTCAQPGAELGAFVAPYVPSARAFLPQPWIVTAQTATAVLPEFSKDLPPQPRLPAYHPLRRWAALNSEYRYLPINSAPTYILR